jgi:hypothetical protein
MLRSSVGKRRKTKRRKIKNIIITRRLHMKSHREVDTPPHSRDA